MAISEPYELDGVTISTTEISIVSGTSALQTVTTAGVYQLWLDPVGASMAHGDMFAVRIYEKVEATGGTKRTCCYAIINNAQTQLWVFPSLILKNGWDMTLQKISGTDRAWDASIRAVTGSAISEPYELDGVTVGSSEISIVSGTTSLQTVTNAGFYQVWVDPTTMAKDNLYYLIIYEKVEATGGTKRRVYTHIFEGVQNQNYFSPILLLKNGWDMTLIKGGGSSDVAFDASIRKIA